MKWIALLPLLSLSTNADAQILLGTARASDGDTLILGDERIGLHGIDALEAGQTCMRDDKTWQCGNEAKTLLAKLVEGKTVQCEQRDRDAYGRIGAVCSAGGLDLARTIVEAGFAIALPQFSPAYVALAERARSLGVGMWGSQFQNPADYRAANPQHEPLSKRRTVVPARPVAPYSRRFDNPSRPNTDVFYRNCAAARAAGAAPMYRGQPGYRPQLDADGDGIACEPYHGR